MVGRDVLGAPRRRIRPPQPHPGARERRATRRASIPPGEPPRQDAGRRGRRPLPTWAGRTERPTWAGRTARMRAARAARTMRAGRTGRPTWTGRRAQPTRAARTARTTWTGRTLRQIVRAKGSAITGRRQSPPGRFGGWHCRKGAAQTGGPPRAATAEVRTRRRAARPAGERRRRQRAAPLRRGNTSRAQSKVSSSSLVSLLPVNSSNSMSARSS